MSCKRLRESCTQALRVLFLRDNFELLCIQVYEKLHAICAFESNFAVGGALVKRC